MAIVVTFFDGFATKKGDGNCSCLLRWFCYEEGNDSNVIAFFYGGGVAKKAMATSFFLLSFFLFSLVFLLQRRLVH